jgi:sialic acid synthase SpsE
MTKTITIGQKKIGDGHPAFIVAEAGCNHNQSLDIAKKLIDMSVNAQADVVKFQTYDAEKLYSKKTPMMAHFREKMGLSEDATMFDLIKATELPTEMTAPIVDYCKKQSIPFISTPFDVESVDFLEQFNVQAYKIASFEMTHYPLIEKVAAQGKPIILSTGMSNLGDIEKVLTRIQAQNNNQIILLHCVSNYPAKPEDYNLRVINTLKTAFGYPVGLSDHTPGVEVAKIAIALGANIIEKHITIDQSLAGPDHHFSLLPEELSALVQGAKDVEAMLGSPHKHCTDAEQSLKTIGRRSLVANKDISIGTKVTAEMIAVKRPGTGLHPELMEELIGVEVQQDIEYDSPLTWEMFFKK